MSTTSPYELMALAFRNRVTRVARSTTTRAFAAWTTSAPSPATTTATTTTSTETIVPTTTATGADNSTTEEHGKRAGLVNTTLERVTSTVMSTIAPQDNSRQMEPWVWFLLGGLAVVSVFLFCWWCWRKVANIGKQDGEDNLMADL